MSTKEQKTKEEHIDDVLNLLEGLDYDMISDILREATNKARKQSILVSNSPNP